MKLTNCKYIDRSFKNFKMLTHVEYIKTVETMKKKMSRGEQITEEEKNKQKYTENSVFSS